MKIVTEKEFRNFAENYFSGKLYAYADSYAYIQAGSCFGLSLHYECDETSVMLIIQGPDWRPIRDYLSSNLNNNRITPSNHIRQNCQWTIDNEIHTADDLFQAFLDIRAIIEPVIERFEGKEPQDYTHYVLSKAKDNTPTPTEEIKEEKVATTIQPESIQQNTTQNSAINTNSEERHQNSSEKHVNDTPPRSNQTKIEETHNDVEQVPVNLKSWPSPDTQGFFIKFPSHIDLWSMGEWELKHLLITEIENEAKKMDRDSIEECLSVIKGEVRAIRNLTKLTGNAKISKGKMIFNYCVEKYIQRKDSNEMKFIGDECDNLRLNPSYPTKYDAPYISNVSNTDQAISNTLKEIEEVMAIDNEIKSNSSNSQIYSYQISQESSKPCTKCKGEKIERCPKCDGSGREQYIDSYFASGEPKYKTGQCSRCYGKGFITCQHCDGTGFEDKGTGISAIAKTYIETQRYEKFYGYITPWFVRIESCTDMSGCTDTMNLVYRFGRHLNKYRRLKSYVRNELTVIRKNQTEFYLDKNSEIRDNLLSQIGYEYGDMYDELQKQKQIYKQGFIDKQRFIKMRQQIKEDPNDYDEKIAWEAQSFLTCSVYKIDYDAGGRNYSICIFVNDDNHGHVDWNGLPEMGLFGGIKNN